MKVRPFTATDLTAVHSIQMNCPQAAQWGAEDYLHLLQDPGATILIADLDDRGQSQVAGFAVLHRTIDEAELRNLAVAPEHRRKGLARALLAESIRILWNSGVRCIFLEVRPSNQPALAIYESAGFRLLYTRRDYYHDPTEDALVMVRGLASG